MQHSVVLYYNQTANKSFLLLLLCRRGVAGEIRERQLADLPSASMYMGRTQLSLADIRQFNQLQGNMRYTLHDNDCR